ncbi:SRPBCC family protein [Algibacter sp. PT7-4]|uniref:SRPBCC family protein n=1 Tax=Algibacter ulvanivorans TaxID=3400999 RepID=UPI003AAFE296
MGIYQFKKTQEINKPIQDVWHFISNPCNLKLITPDYMGFNITSSYLPSNMYAGMIICYKVSPLLGIKMNWVTEITHVKEGKYFVDEQRVGPYKIWHHEHILQASKKGTIMTDIVSYKPPFGIIGSLTNPIIKKKLKDIFDYRFKALAEIF